MRVTKLFENELGNHIAIDIADIDSNLPSVEIRVIGPNSTSTNLLTKLEGEKLVEALNEWIGM